MRSRIVDLALLVGLVAVSGGILWTLFTLGAEPRQANPTPTPPAVTAPPAATDEPGGASAGARGVVAIAPDAVSPDATDATTATDADDPATADASDADAAAPDADTAADGDTDAPPPAPVPPVVRADGTIELERIGFSYVTGGAGACGVVLEAWVHVAVSRDLLAAYGCGAEVTVVLDDPAGGRSEVVGVIGDTMNPSFARTVNVYVGEDEDAFAYGLTTGSFAAR